MNSRIATIRETLANQITDLIPEDFNDVITTELMTDPVSTELGQVFERASIEKWLEEDNTCPLTREPLTKEQLFSVPGIQAILFEFKKHLGNLLKEAAEIKAPRDEIALQKKIDVFKTEIEEYKKQFEFEKRHIVEYRIQLFKNLKKIDIKQAEHLAFWSEKNGCCPFGLVSVRSQGQHFYLTETVFNIFMAANKKYDRVADFHKALQVARYSERGCWSAFWGDTQKTARLLRVNLANTPSAYAYQVR